MPGCIGFLAARICTQRLFIPQRRSADILVEVVGFLYEGTFKFAGRLYDQYFFGIFHSNDKEPLVKNLCLNLPLKTPTNLKFVNN